ncbi:hypothetical protein GF318_05870 [Candidatus Micrarchaeota archaeon]|nr:hypothetical protein [Candidatus Micrarchaeota archaeon]
MILRYLALFLVLSSIIFADCAGYHDIFDVRVLDGKQRPVPGAEVELTYDRGASFGEQYFTTPVKYTDSQGKAHFNLINQGTGTRPIDCNIYITTRTGGSTVKKTIEAETHGPIVDLIHENLYRLRFYVRDHFNAAIENASISIGNRTNKTNDRGYVSHYLESDTYDYFVSYQEAKDSGTITVENDDVDYQVSFHYYDVTIDVLDDYGQPLEAYLTVYNETFLLENGHFEDNRTFGKEISYEAEYKGLSESGTIIAEVDPAALVVFDVHSPTIEKVEPEQSNAITKLVISTTDPGEYASGVDVSSIKVTYRLEPADPTTPWNNAVVFSSGFNTFTAQFSGVPPDSIVQFNIELKDKAGNRAQLDGKFSTLTLEPEENDTQNQTKPQNGEEEEQEFPLFYILGGIILVILVIYLGIRIKSQGS